MRLRIADEVGVHLLGDVVYAAPLPGGPIMVLEGVAALIFNEAVGAPREGVAHAVASRTGQDVASIRPHVDRFIEEMLSRGLITED